MAGHRLRAGPLAGQGGGRARALPPATVLTIACGVAEALQAIHAAGVIHRDLKPSNVLLASDGPRVIDFGIAKAIDATPLTGTGVRVGTPVFMALEQALGHPSTPAVDVFALGGLIHYAATGRPPFGEGPDAAVLYRVVHDEPQLDGCPPQVRDLVAHCLAKDPAQRPTPRDLVARLAAFAQTTPGTWLPQVVDQTLPAYSSPPAPPKPRGRRTVGLRFLAGAIAVTAAAAAVATALLLPTTAAGSNSTASGSKPGPTVTVTQTRPAEQARPEQTQPEQTQPAQDDENTPAPIVSDGGVAGSKPSGTLLGTYKGIDVTVGWSVSFTDDPKHPKDKEDGSDLSYCQYSPALCNARMAVLDPGQAGTHQACVDNTRYTNEIPIEDAKGRLVCVFTDATIGLVKVTRVVDSNADYLTMDLTVWQR